MATEFYPASKPFAASEPWRGLPEHQRDREAERKIHECLSSKNFEHQIISYSYDHQSYELRVIHNPNREFVSYQHKQSDAFTFESALISKNPLPPGLEQHLRNILKQTQDYLIYTSIPSGDEKSEFDKFNLLRIVEGAPYEKRDEDTELWQYLEMVTFIGTAAAISAWGCKLNLISALAYSSIAFLTGKAVYGMSTSKYLAGWTVGALTAAAAGHWVLLGSQTPLTHLQSLVITALTSIVGAAFCLVRHTIVKNSKPPTMEELSQSWPKH